jgi:hypothetical protein
MYRRAAVLKKHLDFPSRRIEAEIEIRYAKEEGVYIYDIHV